MNPIARWAAWRADRRHEKRLRLWLWHKHHPPGPCRCKERIEKLTPKDAPRRTPDAQRRSEATPQKDLSEDIDVEHFGTPGPVWTSARRRVLDDIAAECARRGCTDLHSNVDHDLSRVDPYDTTTRTLVVFELTAYFPEAPDGT